MKPSALKTALDTSSTKSLSRSQQELIVWHNRCCLFGMSTLQRIMSYTKPHVGNNDSVPHLIPPCVIRTKFPDTNKCDIPLCGSCIIANQESITPATKQTKDSSFGVLKEDHLNPGDCISMDQFSVTQKGRYLGSSTHTMVGGTLFVDHCSGKITTCHQSSLDSASTLAEKRSLDREAIDLGFKISSFRSDNGVFKSKEMMSDMHRLRQTIQFSGVGAKHQNGVAERGIRTISYLTRASLIHAALKWPSSHDLSLWPFAMSHATFLYNHMPGRDNLCPIEKWSTTKSNLATSFRRLCPWGCPIYVLDPRIQDGKKIPKWHPRGRQGKFLGFSTLHATSVPLVLNTSSKRVSPQFHVVYDECFQIVKSVDDDS